MGVNGILVFENPDVARAEGHEDDDPGMDARLHGNGAENQRKHDGGAGHVGDQKFDKVDGNGNGRDPCRG